MEGAGCEHTPEGERKEAGAGPGPALGGVGRNGSSGHLPKDKAGGPRTEWLGRGVCEKQRPLGASKGMAEDNGLAALKVEFEGVHGGGGGSGGVGPNEGRGEGL